MKRTLIIPTIILLVTVFIRPSWFRSGTSVAAPVRLESAIQAPLVAVEQKKEATHTQIVWNSVDQRALHFSVPTVMAYREQVLGRGPGHHGMPPVLKEFSKRMGELMENAMTSEPVANSLYDELIVCATDREDALLQARVICAVNATRLGKTYPDSLGEKAQAFREKLPSEMQDYLEALGF